MSDGAHLEMPDISGPSPYIPSSAHDDLEALPTSLRKEASRSILSRLASLVGRFPLLSATLLYVTLVGGIAGLAKWSYELDRQPALDHIKPDQDGIALIGRSYQVDIISQTLSIEWELEGCGAYRLSTYPPPNNILVAAGCDILDRAVDIYLNGVSKPTFSYNPASFPLVQPDHLRSERYQPLYVNALNVFDVVHSLDVVGPNVVPFDAYSLSALVIVIDKATNRSVPIITIAAGEGPDNFAVSSYDVRARSNYTYDPGTGPTTVEVDSRVVRIKVKRSQLAQAFTMWLLIVSSALTVGSIYLTLLVIFGGEGVDNAVLLLPVTIILTIPALRSLYPGSPPFGIYFDTFGFFLQMMTVAACSMILLYKVAVPSTQDRRTSIGSGKTYFSRILSMFSLNGRVAIRRRWDSLPT